MSTNDRPSIMLSRRERVAQQHHHPTRSPTRDISDDGIQTQAKVYADLQSLKIRINGVASNHRAATDEDASSSRDLANELLNGMEHQLPQELRDMVLTHLDPFVFAIVRRRLCPSPIVYSGQLCQLLRSSALARSILNTSDGAGKAYCKTLAAWDCIFHYANGRNLPFAADDLEDLKFGPDLSTCFTIEPNRRRFTLFSLTTGRIKQIWHRHNCYGAFYVGAAGLCVESWNGVEHWSLSGRPKLTGTYLTTSCMREVFISPNYIIDTGGDAAAMGRHHNLESKKSVELPECLQRTRSASISVDESIGLFSAGHEIYIAGLGEDLEPIPLLRDTSDYIDHSGISPDGTWFYATSGFNVVAIEIWHRKHLLSKPIVFQYDSTRIGASRGSTVRFSSASISADSKHLFFKAYSGASPYRVLILRVNDGSVEEVCNRAGGSFRTSFRVLASFLDRLLFVGDDVINLAEVHGYRL